MPPKLFWQTYFVTVCVTFLLLFPTILVYMIHRPKRNLPVCRILLCAVLFLALGIPAPLLISHISLPINYRISVVYLGLYLLIFACMPIIYKGKQLIIDFMVCYSLKQSVGIVYTLFTTSIPIPTGNIIFSMLFLILFSWVCYGVVFVLFRKKFRNIVNLYSPRLSIVIFTAFVFFASLILDSGNTSSVSIFNDPYILGYNILALACYIFILFLQFGLMEENRLKFNMDIQSKIWQEREKQLKPTKQTIDLISLKYHDLKHILTLLKQGNIRFSTEELDKIDDQISGFEAIVETGNTTLDAIIAEKQVFCKHNDIQFSYLVQSKNLAEISPMDTVGLFANALDNAVDAVMKLPSTDRFICINVEETHGTLLIQIENPFSGCVNIQKCLSGFAHPGEYHGFGMTSIQTVVKTYGGDVYFSTDNNIFTMTAFLPLAMNVRHL